MIKNVVYISDILYFIIHFTLNPKNRYQRKRIEILYAPLDDQMMIKRNYPKSLKA